MSTTRDYTKTWIPGPSRVNQTFNAPGNITIPYGRYQATVTGKGGPGNSPQATAWSTNYNTQYPIANRPVANQPATGWTTNYNVQYPVSYPVDQSHYGGVNPPNAFAYVYAKGYSYWARPTYSSFEFWNWVFFQQGTRGPGGGGFYASQCDWNPSYQSGPSFSGSHSVKHQDYQIQQCIIYPGNPFYVTYYNTVYNVVYPVANRPATAWITNYNTNYNVVYPIANQPATAYVLGNVGASASALGVTAPGGPISQAASPISPTAVTYYSYPDNSTYPVTVPSGGQINITIT